MEKPTIYLQGFLYISSGWPWNFFHPSTHQPYEKPSPSENNSQALARRFVDLASLELDKHLGLVGLVGKDIDQWMEIGELFPIFSFVWKSSEVKWKWEVLR